MNQLGTDMDGVKIRAISYFLSRAARNVNQDKSAVSRRYSHKRLPRVRVMACLLLKEYLGLSLRGMVQLLRARPAFLQNAGLAAIPSHPTLMRLKRTIPASKIAAWWKPSNPWEGLDGGQKTDFIQGLGWNKIKRYRNGGLLAATLSALFSVAQAGVIMQQEWESMPPNNGAPWEFNGTAVDCAPEGGASPSGGCALKFTYPAGTYSSSISGGIMGYDFQTGISEFYAGHWIKWSSNWVWNPIGSKMDYVIANPGPDGFANNMLTAVYGDQSNTGGARSGLILTVQRIWGSGSYNLPVNLTAPNFVPGKWYWLELHLKMNTPGQADGMFEMWVGDPVNGVTIQCVQDTTTAYSPSGAPGTWSSFFHSPEWGGGGGTIPSTQYYWVDHTVISTTRIGMPGGSVPSADTTPPAAPRSLRIL